MEKTNSIIDVVNEKTGEVFEFKAKYWKHIRFMMNLKITFSGEDCLVSSEQFEMLRNSRFFQCDESHKKYFLEHKFEILRKQNQTQLSYYLQN